jgi:pyruvate formate lyase activating enzyme
VLRVFNIQRFSIHDGSGVRTIIFFQGCPLSCLWCNNPESLEPYPSIMFDKRLCRRFGDCIKAGKGHIFSRENNLVINRDHISDASFLKDICPSGALTVVGKEMSPDEILAEVEKDITFYTMSGGGVTFSGGEPFAQEAGLKVLIAKLKLKGIHISAETSLHLPWGTIDDYFEQIDVFLADLKHTDAEKFTRFTGGNAALVLDNFRKLDAKGKSFIVRVPVIPRFNFSRSELCSIIDFAAGLKNALEINFIPFHSLAGEKYAMLGKEYPYSGERNIEKADLSGYVEYSVQKGLNAKILN